MFRRKRKREATGVEEKAKTSAMRRAAADKRANGGAEARRMAKKASKYDSFVRVCQHFGLSPEETFIKYYRRMKKIPEIAVKEFDAKMDSVKQNEPFSKTRFYADLISDYLIKKGRK